MISSWIFDNSGLSGLAPYASLVLALVLLVTLTIKVCVYFVLRRVRWTRTFLSTLILSSLIPALVSAMIIVAMQGNNAGSEFTIILSCMVGVSVAATETWRLWLAHIQAQQQLATKNLDKAIAASLMAAFFGGIAALTMMSFITFEGSARVHDDQDDFAELINLAGRQRMLAQAIGREGIRVRENGEQAGLSSLVETLDAEAERVETLILTLDHRISLPDNVRFQADQVDVFRRQILLETAHPTARPDRSVFQAEIDRFVVEMDVLVGMLERWSNLAAESYRLRFRKLEYLQVLLAFLVASYLALPLIRISLTRIETLKSDSRNSQRLALVAKHTTNIVLITDVEGRLEWVNEAFVNLTGYQPGEVIGRKPGDFLQNEKTDPETRKRVAEALAAQTGIRTEILNVDRFGREYWLDMDIRPIHDASGECCGFIAVESDVTQQVDLRTHLSRIYQATPAGIVIHDGSGAIIDCNAEAERLLYMSRDQMMGKTSADESWQSIDDHGNFLSGDQHPSSITLRTGQQVRDFIIGVKISDRPRRWLQVNTIALPAGANGDPAVIATFLDVSEQRAQRMEMVDAHRRSQEALATLESYQQAIRDNAIMSITDENGRIISVNDSFCEISGYSRSEMIGANHRLLKSNHHPQEFYEEMWRALSEGGAWRGEICNRRKDGHLYWVDSIIFPVQSGTNGGKRFVSIRFDITRRKLAEQLVQQSETRMRQALKMANAQAWEIDIRTGRLSLPREMQTEMSMALSQSRTVMRLFRYIHPDDRDAMYECWRQNIQTGRPFDVEHRIRLTDGSYRWVRTFARREHDESGREIIYGLTQDIRDAKLHESMLRAAEREAEDRYQREGILTQTLIAALAESPLEEFLRNSSQGLVNHTLSLAILRKAGVMLIEERDGVQILKLAYSYGLGESVETACKTVQMGHCLCVKAVQSGELQHAGCINDDHEIRPAGMKPHGRYNVPLKVGSETLGVLIVYLPHGHQADEREMNFLRRFGGIVALGIDRRRRLDDLAKARRLAETAARTKAEFLATMSHEIRTPMNGVMGMLELLGQSGLTEKQSKWTRIASQSADSLLTIINDVLDLSKIEAGKMELEALVFSPIELANSVTELLRIAADEKGVSLNVVVDEMLDASFVSDPTRIRQILFNLAGNAVKFTEQGGVDIKLSPSYRFADKAGLRIDIVDSGIGISAEVQEKLFQPFAQADSSTTRAYGGTGLGLAICRRLVDKLGGDIRLQSVEGEGSTFTVEIPCMTAATADIAGEQHVTADDPEPDSLRILVAEDNPMNQQVMSGLLGNDHEVTICHNGQEAVEAAGQRVFDIILMDIHMPVMDGLAATRAIRDMGNSTPIIALTADTSMAADEKFVRDGFDGIVLKPLKIRTLFAEIIRVLSADHQPADMDAPDTIGDESPVA